MENLERDLARAISLLQEFNSTKIDSLTNNKMTLTELASILEDSADTIYQELQLVDDAILESSESEESDYQDYANTESKTI